MKRFLRIYSVLCILIALALYRYHFSRTHSELEKIRFCKGSTSPLNYVGSSLISNSFDSEDLVFCPGDYFGDLNNTYLIVKNCYLEMYHQEKLIWSSTPNSYYGGNIENSEYACALSLQRDGNVVLYREGAISVNPMGIKIAIFPQWESQTSLSPLKTELKVKDQQVQIQQTFRNGKERLFYVGEENQTFKEDMGEPKKIANKFVLKKSEEKDKTIFSRNEYIGNLNDTYLILQTNCELQLLNKDKILWSITSKFRHEMNCALTTNERNQVVISKFPNHQQKNSESQKIMLSDDDLKIVENRITFEDDQPMIIQTLKNGSDITFAPGFGATNAFKPKRAPRQLAKKTLHVAKDDESFDTIERMDYIILEILLASI